MMKWSELFCDKRERESKSAKVPYRNCFDMDYDRIVSSSSIRRLKDKAQVFPLQENDFTRTRLTHSLEVSAIGESIGKNVEHRLLEMKKITEEERNKLPSLLRVAGLVHDLGNPPFGHYGETIIRTWMKNNSNDFLNIEDDFGGLTSDFKKFDGNAQTIRILTRLQILNDKHGVNFCYGTLATLMKYPWASNITDGNKFGYFDSEKELCQEIIKCTGVVKRHPATYLLEAADDIAYLFADLEDALKKNCLPWNKVYQELKYSIGKNKSYSDIFTKCETGLNINKEYISEEYFAKNLLQNFKIQAQGFFINKVCDEFIDKYSLIMNGEYDQESLMESDSIKLFSEKIREYCREYVYKCDEVLKLEIAGDEVLNDLLNKFVPAALDENNYKNHRTKSGKLYSIISENIKMVQFFDENGSYNPDRALTKYQRVQIVLDFISGMTDSYALKLSKELSGRR